MPTAVERAANIRVDEAREWFGSALRPAVSDVELERFASAINRMLWPGDPEPLPGSPGYVEELTENDDDRVWPIGQTADAIRLLQQSLPKIAAFWRRQSRFLRDNSRYEKLLRLQDAVAESRLLVEEPFGPVSRRSGLPRQSKEWHVYACSIARIVMAILQEAGHRRISLERNSVLVRVAHETLKRMRIGGSQTITASGVSMFLKRWNAVFEIGPEKLSDHKTQDRQLWSR